ncbi:MAG: GGDEF domain-containing protein [Pseudomonadota bacterium]
MASRRSPVTNPGASPAPSTAGARPPESAPVAAAGTKPPAPRAPPSSVHAPSAAKPRPVAAGAAAADGTASRAAPLADAAEAPSARWAKAALRRLVLEKLEPTPANYARAYQQEAGDEKVPALPDRAQRLVDKLALRAFDGQAGSVAVELGKALSEGRWDAAERLIATPDESAAQWATLMDRVVRGVERGGKQWTTARKKDSLQRVLAGSRGDAVKLQQRLGQLLISWETDKLEEVAEVTSGQAAAEPATEAPAPAAEVAAAAASPAVAPEPVPKAKAANSFEPGAVPVGTPVAQLPDGDPDANADDLWHQSVEALSGTVEAALPLRDPQHQRLADAIHQATRRLQREGASTALADEITLLCVQANRVVQHRHHLVDQLGQLCHELTASLTDLTENDSWVQGQCDAMHSVLNDGLTARGVKAVSDMLHHTRVHQGRLHAERGQARDALKVLIQQMLTELGELGSQTGRFHESVGRYADVIDKADSLESLAGAVREMVEESRTVQELVQQTQHRLQSEHSKADVLSQRVSELETELRRLSQEVSTDQLTQIANRRGLLMAFDAERARMEREGCALCIGLLDIDNFKRLNDELGHAAGDEALKALAAVVSQTLRPTDMVARYGGEEFVVLLPNTPVDEGQQILTRLQRTLTGGLFMHEQKQIFVTFSAGVTAYRLDERIEEALERADQALYEAKRTGKNRTCLG